MIILTLGGGLGNQMFEYAFARMVQNVAGDEIIKLSLYHVTEYGIIKNHCIICAFPQT